MSDDAVAIGDAVLSPATSTPADGDSSSRSSAVQVAVRVRPLSADKRAQGSEPCVALESDSCVRVGERRWAFDAALAPSDPQRRVFEVLVAPLVSRFFDGINATVLAYGQTGSGKTFTMGSDFRLSGAPGERGVLPRVVDAVLQRAHAAASEDKKVVVRVSFLEILNEEIYDLLAGPSNSGSGSTVATAGLSVRDEGKRGIVVAGLSEHAVESPAQVAALLTAGALHRATASTTMNAQSSRSHAICTLTLEQFDAVAEGVEARFSKFHLVDLAGSERVKRTNAQGARFKEGVNINRGLLALGNVINALCERSRLSATSASAVHVPYRDSKLTRLLQDSLGGNSKTLMVACVSPADLDFEETSNTLRYASRARSIQNTAVVNKEVSAANEVVYLKQQLEVLQLQLMQQQQRQCRAKQQAPAHLAPTQANGELDAEVAKWKSIALTREEELRLVMSAKDKWKKVANGLLSEKRGAPTASSAFGGAARDGVGASTPLMKTLAQEAMEFERTLHVLVPAAVAGALSSGALEEATSTAPPTSQEQRQADLDSLSDVIAEKEKIVRELASLPSASTTEVRLASLAASYKQKISQLEDRVEKLSVEKKRLSLEIQASSGAQDADGASRQRQVKEDADAHRRAKREQDLKIHQLKRQDERKQLELQRLGALHAKQSSALKRKTDEVALANKRMRVMVASQQKSRPSLSKAPSLDEKQPGGKSKAASRVDVMDSISAVLERTLEVQITIHGAKRAIAMDMEERRRIALEISAMEADASTASSDALAELKESLKEKNGEIRLLQQKLASVERTNAIPDEMFPSSAVASHQVIRFLIETAVESKSTSMELESAKTDVVAVEEQLVLQRHASEHTIAGLKREMRELGRRAGVPLDSAFAFYSAKSAVGAPGGVASGASALMQQELDAARAEVGALKAQLAAQEAAMQKKPAAKKRVVEIEDEIVSSSGSDDASDDASDDDSDYVEHEYKKPPKSRTASVSTARTAQRRPSSGGDAMDEIDDLLATPSRVGAPLCCSCSTKCATKACACKAEKRKCGGECACNASRCHNREGVESVRKAAAARKDTVAEADEDAASKRDDVGSTSESIDLT